MSCLDDLSSRELVAGHVQAKSHRGTGVGELRNRMLSRSTLALSLLLVGACDSGPRSSPQSGSVAETPSLRDPVLERLGSDKAMDFHLNEAAMHLDRVFKQYATRPDVLGQVTSAWDLLRDKERIGHAPPIVIEAKAGRFATGDRIHIDAINTNRETDRVLFYFYAWSTMYVVCWQRDITVKDERFDFLQLLPFRRVTKEVLDRAVSDDHVSGVKRVVIRSPFGYSVDASSPGVLLPSDKAVPVFVAIGDRLRGVSGVVRLGELSQAVETRIAPGLEGANTGQ